MTTHYTRTGFVVDSRFTDSVGSEIQSLIRELDLADNQSFKGQLSLLEKIITLSGSFGNTFKLALRNDPISVNAKRFLLTYANMAVANKPPIGVTSVDSWLVMLTPTDGELRQPPNWTPDEIRLLGSLFGDHTDLYVKFAKGAGTEHYFDFLSVVFNPS